MPILVEYHQPAFRLLHEKLRDQIHGLLITDPSLVRAQHLLANLPAGEELPPERSWPAARSLLDVLEAEMARSLRRRSVFFWLHIYRRIGVGLYPLHEGKTDPRTVGLVRQLVELAITKYGRVSDAREIVLSSRVNPDHILGGFMRAGVKQLAESQPSRTYREFAKAVKARPQWVIRDFSEEDFLDIYRVEGFAYQYWRVTALLRALGKGSRIRITPDGDWEYELDSDLAWLLQSIDKRTENGPYDTSLLGTWIDGVQRQSGEGEERPAFDHVICPIYNVSNVKLSDSFKTRC